MINKFKELYHDNFFIRAFIFGIIINALCVAMFMCSPQVVHAASQTNTNLPYVVIPDGNNATYIRLRQILSASKGIDLENLPAGSFFFLGDYESGTLYIPQTASPSYSFSLSETYNNFNYQNNYAQLHLTSNYRKLNWHCRYSGNGFYGSDGYVNNEYIYFFASNNYPFISVGDYYVDSTNTTQRVWTDTIPIALPTGGDPSVFDDTGLNLDSSIASSTPPTVPSSYTPSIPTAPTWDSSQPVQSIFDYLIWGFDVLNTLLQGILSKLIDWFNYFKNLIGYVIQKILDYLKAIVEWLYNQFLNWLTPYLKIWEFISGLLFNEESQKSVFDLMLEFFGSVAQWLANFWSNSFIVNFWTDFYDNIVDSYEDILDKIDDVITAIDNVRLLFTRDPDYSLIVTTFYTTYFGRVYQAVMRLLGAIVDGFTSIQAPGTLSFTVNFSSAPAPFDSVGYLTFNFDWYENIRDVVVPIITTCVYFGFSLHIVWSWRCMLMDTASLKPDVTIQPYSPTPGKAKVNYTSSGAAGGGLVPTWRTYPGQKRIRG